MLFVKCKSFFERERERERESWQKQTNTKPNSNKLFNRLTRLSHVEISLEDSNLYNPYETKRNQIFKPWESIRMESNVSKAGFDGCFFVCYFHNVSMNQSLHLLFCVVRQCRLLFGKLLENITHFVSDDQKKRQRFTRLTRCWLKKYFF